MATTTVEITASRYLSGRGLDIELIDFDFSGHMDAWASIRALPRSVERRLGTLGWAVAAARSLEPGMLIRCDDDNARVHLNEELAHRGLALECPYSATMGQVEDLIVLTREQRRVLEY